MSKKLTGHDVNKQLREAGRKIQMVNPDDYVNNKTPVRFICEHGHIRFVSPGDVVNRGRRCPHCSGNAPRTPESFAPELFLRNIVMDVMSFSGMSHKAHFYCLTCEHDWRAMPTDVVNSGKGCPHCAKYGFSPDKNGYLYLMKFEVDGTEFLKYGITNTPKKRYSAHRSQGMKEVLLEKRFEIGIDAKHMEDLIKQRFGGRHVSKDVLPDGHTETLPLHLLEDVKRMLSPS